MTPAQHRRLYELRLKLIDTTRPKPGQWLPGRFDFPEVMELFDIIDALEKDVHERGGHLHDSQRHGWHWQQIALTQMREIETLQNQVKHLTEKKEKGGEP